jgi:tRNA A37 threonylcarbamoyladenosine synthetase subunit TsaC/SUA5/YrdC
MSGPRGAPIVVGAPARRPAPRWRFGEAVAPLAALLAGGGVVAIPTESSYGLGAAPTSAAGVEAVYRIKARLRGKALPVVVAGLGQLGALGLDPGHPLLAAVAAFWPGPLTVALPLHGTAGGAAAGGAVADGAALGGAALGGAVAAAAGGGTLAVRVPGHARLVELLASLGHGLTATSANRSGDEPILDPEEVAWLLAGEPAAVVVDDGVLPGGLPSTLVEPARGRRGGAAVRILRPGSLAVEALRARLEIVE